VAEVTNYIDRLVAELCPDGVEYRPLSDVVEKNYGGGTPSKAKEEYWGGDIPWASVGDLSNDLMEIFDTRSKITPAGVSGSSTNVVPAGAVIVAIKIAPGKMKIAGVDLAINQDIRGLVLNDLMNARFLTYYFRTLMFAGHGTIVKSITNKRLMDTEVPVPPVEIQEAIVEILDKFTNLEAELEARTLQYEYYRDSLFEALDCPRVPLDSFAKIKNGKTYKEFGAGNIPVYGSGGIMTYVDRSSYDKPTVLIPRKGSLGNLFYLEEPFWNVDTIFYTEIDEEQVIPKFLYYFLKTAHLEDLNTAGGVPSLTQKVLNKVLIPVPSLEEQQRIVDILDRFDALTSSLSEGLPAELAARRSQYEYYRDQLLTFPRKGENQ
jgi:restriction endonuclease S subunit